MKGISRMRHPGAGDPVLKRMLDAKGLTEAPVFERTPRKVAHADWVAARKHWMALVPNRDGPVAPKPAESDPQRLTDMTRAKAREIGVADMGCAALKPIMIAEGVEFPYRNIISLIVAEDYAKVLDGALAVEAEAVRVYNRCAEVATELAIYVRALGYPAVADHNGTGEIQAIPALYACGLGELGKHGSLIHPQLGAGFRPSFVITDAPVMLDVPNIFGVQDTCVNCNLCTNNCPPAAIPPSDDYVVTERVRRWLTNIERCYESSRMREEYCHICVDVCPYVHKVNHDAEKRCIYKAFMTKRRQAGYRTPAWFIEDEPKVLGAAGRE